MRDYLLSQQPQENMEQTQGQAPYNPFDAGIKRAVESARQSLDMTDKQQHKALRRGMLSFAQNMQQQPREKGFWNNFASIGRAAAPAMLAYDDEESNALAENQALSEKILAYQAAEQQRQALEEERQWKRDFAERQLGESVRSHNLLDKFRRDQLAQEQAANNPTVLAPETFSALGGDLIPIESKNERLMYAKDKKSTGEILNELNSIKKDYEKFRDLTKDHLIDPMTPYGIGSTANKAKDFFGYFSNDEHLREATKERKALESKLTKFATEIERKLKGGVLSMGMIKMFEDKNILPSLEHDRPEIFEQKMDNLIEEISANNKAAKASLKYNVHLSPYDLQKLENPNQTPELVNQSVLETQLIRMQAPDGSEYEIPTSEVEEALRDGFVQVGTNE